MMKPANRFLYNSSHQHSTRHCGCMVPMRSLMQMMMNISIRQIAQAARFHEMRDRSVPHQMP